MLTWSDSTFGEEDHWAGSSPQLWGLVRSNCCQKGGKEGQKTTSRRGCQGAERWSAQRSCTCGWAREWERSILLAICGSHQRPRFRTAQEKFNFATTNVTDGARADVSAQGFWGDRYQRAFFDVKVFNPNSSSYRNLQLTTAYRNQEREKQRKYEQRIREVEMGSFTPLVFSTSGGMSKTTTTAYKRLASLLADNSNTTNPIQLWWPGSASICPSPCSDQPSPACVEQGHLQDTLPERHYP